jgi:hypothetical protein
MWIRIFLVAVHTFQHLYIWSSRKLFQEWRGVGQAFLVVKVAFLKKPNSFSVPRDTFAFDAIFRKVVRHSQVVSDYESQIKKARRAVELTSTVDSSQGCEKGPTYEADQLACRLAVFVRCHYVSRLRAARR